MKLSISFKKSLLLFRIFCLAVLLEFSFASHAQTIVLGSFNLSLCQNSNLAIPFTITGTFNSGNIFTAQLSDSAGSFTTLTSIGTLSGITSGTINSVIANNQIAGNKYRIRIIATSPSIMSVDNGSNISINSLPAITITASPNIVICIGTKVTFNAAVINGGSNPQYKWIKNRTLISGTLGNSYSDSTLHDNDTIKCILTSNSATCGSPNIDTSNELVMFVDSLSSLLSPTAIPPRICVGDTAQLFAGISTNNFTVSSIPYIYIPVPTNATVGPSGDDNVGGPYPLPFTFDFFGNTYNQFYISTNGNIQFGPTTDWSFTPGPLPNTSVTNFAALCWSDIIVGSNGNSNGKIRFFVDGVAPRRKMVIDWDSCAFYGNASTTSVAGQIILYETTRIVETHLKRSIGFATTGGGIKTIGVNNFNGTIGAPAPARNGTVWQISTPEAWRFIPAGNYVYAWSPAISLNDSTLPTPIATPDTTTKYKLRVSNSTSGCVGQGTVTVSVGGVADTINLRGCDSASYRNIIYHNSISVKDTLKNIKGCDSIYLLVKITVFHLTPIIQNISVKGCNSIVYNGITYTNSTTKVDTIRSVFGCDSVHKVATITIYHITPITQQINLSGCNGVVYNGVTYTSSIVLRDTIQSVQQCDSVYKITNIVVHQISPVNNNLTLKGCNSGVTYNGVIYNASTVLKDTIRSYEGCDSVYKTVYIIVTYINPLTPANNLLPINNATISNFPVSFSWNLVANAQYYDFYLWLSTGSVPTTPTIANLSQINFAYSGQLQYGSTYKWKIVAKFGACTSESAIQQFSTRLLPDLIVDSVTVPITATSESDITVKWRVKNQGLGSTVSGWNDYAYFSDYPGFVWGGNAVLIASPGNFSSLSPGTTYTSNSFTYHIPVGYQGTYYVFVKTNAYGQEAEITDTNNTRISIPITVTLAPPPDLKVDSLVVSPTTVFSASQLNVKFNIKNAGTVPTNASSWTDNIYLSQDAVFNSNNATLLQTNYHNGTLAVSGYYKVNATVTLPQYIGGTYYIHVVTDAANNVFENSNENNNTTTSSPITVVLLPTPNLTVKNLTILNDTASNNQGINLQWTTVNEGAITAKPSWAENVYLSADTIFNESSDPVFGNAYRQDSIISLAANTIQINKNVPYNTPEGNYYFFVKTDVNNSIFETAAGELDNVSKYAGSIRIVNADLVPTLFTTPSTATSEQTITVSWNVSNATRATIYSNGWYDKVYLSTDNAISSGDIVLSNVLINTFIGPNGNYISQATFTIPVGISGSYFLILKADDGDAVFEKNESNNTLSKAIAITLAPWADLKVTSVTPPSRDTVGTFINFSYTEQNISTGVLQNRTWNDAVYLSPTATLNDPNAILLGNINQAGRTLNASQSFTQSASLYLPTSIDSGTYYLLVVADANNSIFENTGENNNRTVSSAILIKKLTVIVVVNHTPHVDLAVISGKVTDTSVTAGKPVNLQWTVKNVSDSSTTVTPWTDAVYLSNDSVLNSGDQLLGTFGVNGPLVSHATYTQNVSVVVPQNASGTLYFIVTADNGNVHNDTNRINNNLVLKNNVGGNVIVIIVPPPCDLIPLSITTPPKIYNGQPVKVKFSVKNNGTGVTPAKTWKDRFYLSTNTVLDAGDILIGTSTRNDSLQAGAQYTDSVMANIPATFSGNYILIIKTDADDNVYEPNDNNNVAFSGINITQQSPSDLIVAGITTPVGTQISGSNISVNWNLKNVGPNPAIGYLKEAVYLSKDSILDGNDVLFGTTESTINLPSLGLENHVLAATLNNVSVGDYYVIVRTDLLNNIVELSDSNNVTISTSLLNVNVKELILNVVKTDSIKGSSPLTYRIEIPAGLKDETLSVKLTGDSVNNPANRLYLSYNTIPSANSFDFASLVPFQSKQEAIVPALKQGTYYLTGLGPVASADTQKVTLLAKIIPFSITDVDAKQGGNTGSVTVKISGAKFETNTLFKLAAGGNEIIADHLTYVNSTTVFATFNLIGKSLGFYTAKAVNSVGTVTQLANAFEIVTGSPGGGLPGSGFTCSIDNVGFDNNFEVTDQHPRTARTNTTATITIIFRNTGNVDIPIQRRVFTSPKQVYINFAQSYTDSLNNVLLECKEAGGPPDILRPGAIGYIKVYARIVGGAHEIINFLVNE